MGAVLWFFETAGSEAWLWCWATAAAFSLFGAFLAPTWILPLFNRFEPLEEGSLRERILTYSRSVSFPVDGLFVIDGSRRSSRANAFFTGLGRTKRIALFDTLVEQHTEDELVSVVVNASHERREIAAEREDRGVLESLHPLEEHRHRVDELGRPRLLGHELVERSECSITGVGVLVDEQVGAVEVVTGPGCQRAIIVRPGLVQQLGGQFEEQHGFTVRLRRGAPLSEVLEAGLQRLHSPNIGRPVSRL